MFDLPIIEIIITLAFIFFVMSVLASWIVELYTILPQNSRGAFLFDLIKKALDEDEVWSEKIYAHPLVKSLIKGERKPSYLTPEIFRQVLYEEVMKRAKAKKLHPRMQEKVSDGANELMDYFFEGLDWKKDAEEIKQRISDWYQQYMDRASGYYKRKTSWRLFWVGLIAAVLVNVDAIYLTNQLSQNAHLRKAAVQTIMNHEVLEREQEQVADWQATPTDDKEEAVNQITSIYENLRLINIPIGWDEAFDKDQSLAANISRNLDWVLNHLGLTFLKILGWMVTAIALTFGAPFWFDVLRKFANIRMAGKKP